MWAWTQSYQRLNGYITEIMRLFMVVQLLVISLYRGSTQVRPSRHADYVMEFYVFFLYLFYSDNVYTSECISYTWQYSLPRVDPVFTSFVERLCVCPSFLRVIRHTSTCRPRHMVYVTFVGFVCPYVRTTLEHPCTTVWFGMSTTVWIDASTEFSHYCMAL